MSKLSERPKYDRTPAYRKKPGKVTPAGGMYGAGLIEGVSIITQGEALGHDQWIDEAFNQQVAAALNAMENGVKSRFAHPSLSGDGMGTVLGRITNARVEGGQVFGDLHLNKSSAEAPDGNLNAYVSSLAQEDDKAFGLSIAFEHDEEAEAEFWSANLEEFKYQDRNGDEKTGKRFKSPDPKNAKNLFHVRLGELRAADVVDDPAANPQGLFYRGQDIPIDADKVLCFALGLATEKPTSMFGVDPDRLKGFVTRSLAAHGYEIKKKEEQMSSQTEQKPAEPNKDGATAPDQKADLLSQMGVYTDAFGAEKGVAWFREGKPLVDCWRETAVGLKEQLAAAQKQVTELQAKVKENRGEKDPLSFSNGGQNGDKDKPLARIAGRN